MDDLTDGGLYAFSCIAGFHKLGKTMLAVRAAVEAARAGWAVAYYLSENQDYILRRHLINVFQALPDGWPDWVEERLFFLRFYPKHSMADLVQNAVGVLDLAALPIGRLLIVIDHVNALADGMATHARDRMNRPYTYWRALDEIIQVGKITSEECAGDLATLYVSEVNRQGGVKGQKLEYAYSGCLVQLRGTGLRSRVNIEVGSRESPGADLGEFVRHYAACEFRSAKLEVVQGGKS